MKGKIYSFYISLLKKYGEQNWWPCSGEKFGNEEIAVGAILTQNTSWENVEKGLKKLKEEMCGKIELKSILEMEKEKLKECIKCCGFYNQKTEYLKNFASYIVSNYGTLRSFFKEKKNEKIEKKRKELLSIKGIGKETCDSILLYSGFLPVFVVDKYTFRIFKIEGIIGKEEKFNYEKIRRLVENEINDVKDLQEFHALLVREGKEIRKKRITQCVC